MTVNPEKIHDRTAMAALATKLRSHKTRSQDPDLVTMSSADAQAAGDRAVRLSRTMARAMGERPAAGMTAAEVREIDRIAAEQGIGR